MRIKTSALRHKMDNPKIEKIFVASKWRGRLIIRTMRIFDDMEEAADYVINSNDPDVKDHLVSCWIVDNKDKPLNITRELTKKIQSKVRQNERND